MDDTTTEVELFDLESAAARIDRIIDSHRRGIVTTSETLRSIEGTVMLFLHFSATPPDEASLLADYAREAVATVAERPEVRDPVLVDYFDDWLEGERLAKQWLNELERLLERIEGDVMRGHHEAFDELRELCRHGFDTHRALFRLHRSVEMTLRTAHRLGVADALRDAVSPEHQRSGQIAGREQWPDLFVLAFNLLAHLAADPERGASARSALLDLADFIETAGEAVIRLPLHLLDDDDRQRLVEIHERRVDLFAGDTMSAPLGLALLRDNRVVRSTLWQAFDARHIT